MERRVLVYIDIDGEPRRVGRLWSRYQRGRETASFEYDPDWLRDTYNFSLEPALSLDAGRHHTPSGKALFGAFGDSAPDRWGRVLMRRAERRSARSENRDPRTLLEIDYLLMVNDETRQGALRFKESEDEPFLATDRVMPIPPLVQLPRLLTASDNILDEHETDEDLRLLLAPGSSLGGARPKASVYDHDGHLAFAKFPHPNDEMPIEAWEAIALSLARKAGIPVPAHRLEKIADKPVLILRRFDRTAEQQRQPYLSAMSMLGANENETHSYMEIADLLARYGAQPAADRRQLWRRMVFNVLISNTDDHLRNHGFLYQHGCGWTLAPAFDLNPRPLDLSPRVLNTTIGLDDPSASLELALENAAYFDLDAHEARTIAREVADATAMWQKEAEHIGLTRHQSERMATAFEHADSSRARTL